MILATFKMMIPLEKHAEVAKILTRTVERTRVEPDGTGCHFYMDMQDKRGVVIEEAWMSNDDLVRHLSRKTSGTYFLWQKLPLKHRREVFSDVIQGNGMETIGKVRSVEG